MPADSLNPTNSIRDLHEIDRICQQFESSWQSGQQPVIERYVDNVDESLRENLLRELLLLEVDYRSRKGEQPSEDEYHARFPQDSQLVSDLFEALSTGATKDVTSPYPSAHVSGEQTLPAQFGDYELLEVLGEGGMGTVYLARQSNPDRAVALKVIRPDRWDMVSPDRRQELLDRFRSEAQAAAKLEHENIVPVYEVGQFGERSYFSMRYIEGDTLHDRLEDGPLEGREAADLLKPAATAVHYAHVQGLLHRDLKPQNVLIDSKSHLYVTDFGLAKSLESPSGITHTGEVLGTPSYMSPEQAQGEGNLSAAVDIYGLGATLYEMLTGRPPFRAASFAETLRQVIHDQPVSPRRLNPAIDRDLETICLKCLEKESRRRYTSAQEFRDELNRYVRGQPIHARPISRAARTWRWCRRNPWAALAVCLLLILAIGSPPVAMYQVHATSVIKQQNEDLEDQGTEIKGLYQEVSKKLDETTVALARAERAERQARIAQELAEQESLAKRRALYLSDLKRMETLWDQSNVRTMRTLLARHVPQSREETDLREFEWFYWQRQLNREQRRLDHGESVQHMALAPDGKHMVTAGAISPSRFAIQIWELETGSLKRTLSESTLQVTALSFVGEEPRLNVVLENHTQQQWDWQAGKLLFSQPVFYKSGFSWSDRRREAYAFADSGSFFAVSNGSTVILRAKGRTPYTDFEVTVPGIERWRLSSQIMDSGRGITPSVPTGPSTWLPGDELTPPREEDGGPVFALAICPRERRLAAGSRNGELFIWDIESGQQQFHTKAHDDIVWDIAFSPDGTHLATASKDGLVKVWNVEQARLLITISGHQGSARCVAFSRKGLLATAGDDQTVRIWSVSSGRPLALFRGHELAIIDVAFGPDEDSVWSASRDGTVKQWPVVDRDQPVVIADQTSLYCLDDALDGRVLAAAGYSSQISVWDLGSGLIKASLVGKHDQICHLRFADGGNQLVAAAWDGTFSKWNVASGDLVWEKQLPVQRYIVGMPHVAISPGGRLVAGACLDKKVRVIDLESDQEVLLPTDKPVVRLLFSPKANQVLSVVRRVESTGKLSKTSDLTLWNSNTGEVVADVVSGVTILAVCFAEHGRYLAWSQHGKRQGDSPDTEIVLWDISSREITGRIPVPTDVPRTRALALSPDGRRVAALVSDAGQSMPAGKRFLLIWDAASGELIQRVPESGRSVAFANGGQQLVVAADDGRVRFWSVIDGSVRSELKRPSGPLFNATLLSDRGQLEVIGQGPKSAGLIRTTLTLDGQHQKQQFLRFYLKSWKLSPILLANGKLTWTLWTSMGLDQARVARYRLSKIPFPREAYAIKSNQAFVLTSTGALLRDNVGGGNLAIAEGVLKKDDVCTGMTVSPDGHWVAIAAGRNIELWDGSTLKAVCTLKGHEDYIHALAFSRDGSQLASGSADRTVRVWDVEGGTAVGVLMGHTQNVTCVTFTASGRTVASSSRDGTIQLWDIESGQSKTTLTGHEGPVHWVGFSPDGSILASTGEDSTVRVWKTMPRNKGQ